MADLKSLKNSASFGNKRKDLFIKNSQWISFRNIGFGENRIIPITVSKRQKTAYLRNLLHNNEKRSIARGRLSRGYRYFISSYKFTDLALFMRLNVN